MQGQAVRNEEMIIFLNDIFKNLSRNQPAKEKEQWINILYDAKQVNNKILLQYQDICCCTVSIDWDFIFSFIIHSFGWHWEVT